MTKNAIAETIIALTKMEEEFRSPVRCIATTRVGVSFHLVCIVAVIGLNKLSKSAPSNFFFFLPNTIFTENV